MKWIIAVLIAFLLGAGTRWFGIPVPAPPKIEGALLILAITIGYIATDAYLAEDDGNNPQKAEVTTKVAEEPTPKSASE